MEESTQHTLHVEAIRKDLGRIVDDWLNLRVRISVLFVVITFIVECLMTLFISRTNILSTTIVRYILKFILAPSGIATICVFIDYGALRSKTLSQRGKTYVVSLIFVFICFLYYTAHSAFIATYALFVVAIILTSTYADYRLTSIVSIVSVVLFTLSELLLGWDLDKVSALQDSNRLVDFLAALSILLGCCMIANVSIYYERRKNEVSLRREVERELLKESLRKDELTGVYNRKALHDALRLLEQQGVQGSFVFGIADIDFFKEINDQFGHQVGDQFLSEFTCVLCEYFGESSIYRYGGDEFCLLLQHVGLDEAASICARVQIRLQDVKIDDAPDHKLTASFGLSRYTEEDGISRLFLQADEALYEAKEERNKVCVFSGALPHKSTHIGESPVGDSRPSA